VLTIGMGIWLTVELGLDFGATWLSVTFALVAWLLAVGAVAGRQDRHTRELAERLGREGDAPSPELGRRLRDPLNLALNASMLAAIGAVIALMVFRPGL
jgi:uncharacterized membrane protein